MNMKMKLITAAVCCVFGLVGCGGTRGPLDLTKKERMELERDYVKWRQIKGEGDWKTSKDHPEYSRYYADNPREANPKLSPSDKAVVYINASQKSGIQVNTTGTDEIVIPEGVGKWDPNPTYEKADFRKKAFRDTTDYDPEFLSQAELSFDKLQQHDIKDKESGKVLAHMPFINQKYSSYLVFRSHNTPRTEYNKEVLDTVVGYVAKATPTDKVILDKKVKASYQGHTIASKERTSTEFVLADVSLDADFQTMTLKGKITNRNDALLDQKIMQDADGKRYTDNKDDEYINPNNPNDKWNTYYLTPEQVKARKEALRRADIDILEANISVDNGVIGFRSKAEGPLHRNAKGLQYKDFNGDVVNPEGSYVAGIFAGPNAEEVVGEVFLIDDDGEQRASFGAHEVQK